MIPSLALTLGNRIPASPVRLYGEEGKAFFGALIGVLRDDGRIPKSWQIPSHPYIVPILSAMLEYHFEHVGLEASRKVAEYAKKSKKNGSPCGDPSCIPDGIVV